MKTTILLPIILLPMIGSAISINEIVQKSIQTHPQISISKDELNTQKRLLVKSESDYYPSIDLSCSAGPEKTKTVANAGETESLVRQEATATLSLNVFSGLDTVYGVKQQKAQIKSASNGVIESENSLALEAVTAYINVLRTSELLKIAKESSEVHKKYLSQIKEKFDAGVGRASDYKQTLSRYENTLSNQYLTEQNYNNAIASFQRIIPGEVTAEDFEKPTIGNMPAEDLESLIQMALNNNPTIKVSKDDIEIADASLSRSYSTFYPRVDIKAESYWNKNVHGVSTDPSNPNPSPYEQDSGQNVMLVLSYNIFNGFSDKAQKEANQHVLLNKKSTLADTKRYIIAYTQIAWQTFVSTKKQLVHIENNVQATKDTVADYQEENDLGRRSIIDLLNIEVEYNNAKNRQVTTQYDRLISYYQILSYTGKILDEMNVLTTNIR